MVFIEYFSVVLVDMTLGKLHFFTGTFEAKIGRKWATNNGQLTISLHIVDARVALIKVALLPNLASRQLTSQV